MTATSVTLGALALGTIVPTALATTNVAEVVDALVESATVYDATQPDNVRDGFGGLPEGTVMVLTPGTDDGTLIARNLPVIGDRTTLVVNYPQAFGPIIAGRSGKPSLLSPSYDVSKAVAMEQNLAVMTAFAGMGDDRPFVVYTGFSQGADALGDAAEDAFETGLIPAESTAIILVSDPRNPWGIKAWLATTPVLPELAGLIGIESNGARDPRGTGDVEVTSIIIVGDPIGNFQWVWYRPATSAAVNVAGFLTIHSGNGSQTYGEIDSLGTPTLLTSRNTTYAVYDAAHPFALLFQLVHDELGIPYSSDDFDKWDRLAEAYYPTHAPTPATAAPGVSVTAGTVAGSATTTADGYSVTVPAAVATGTDSALPQPDIIAPGPVDGDAASDAGDDPAGEVPSDNSPYDVDDAGAPSDSGSSGDGDPGDPAGDSSDGTDADNTDSHSADTADTDSSSGSDAGSASEPD
nr:hypothetical protein [Gordonia jinghuaiqii]